MLPSSMSGVSVNDELMSRFATFLSSKSIGLPTDENAARIHNRLLSLATSAAVPSRPSAPLSSMWSSDPPSTQRGSPFWSYRPTQGEGQGNASISERRDAGNDPWSTELRREGRTMVPAKEQVAFLGIGTMGHGMADRK